MAKNPDRVAVLETHVGQRLIIRANPTMVAVRGFVAEHNRRFLANEPGGPSGIPAFQILSAAYYPSEEEIDDPEKAEPIDIRKAQAEAKRLLENPA